MTTTMGLSAVPGTMTFDSLLRLLRGTGGEDRVAAAAYRARLEPHLAQFRAIVEDWELLTQYESDGERLGNAISVKRWEIARLTEQVERLEVSPGAQAHQRDIVEALIEAGRACQLLATGYRFNKSEAVCDGQVRLQEIREDVDETLSRLPAPAVSSAPAEPAASP